MLFETIKIDSSRFVATIPICQCNTKFSDLTRLKKRSVKTCKTSSKWSIFRSSCCCNGMTASRVRNCLRSFSCTRVMMSRCECHFRTRLNPTRRGRGLFRF